MTNSEPVKRGSFVYSQGLQVLRGLAALMIVFIHLGVAEGRYGALLGSRYLNGFRVGLAGVDVFFVISGFVMMMVVRNKALSPKLFLKNRLTRIYPNYWFYFLLVTMVWLVRPGWVNSSMTGTPDFLSAFFLLPSTGPPVVSVAWTLEFEIYFYLVFTLFLWISRKNLPLLLIMFFTILVLLGAFFKPESLLLERLTHPLLLEFSTGVFLGWLLMTKQIPGGWLAIPLALFIFLLFQLGYELTQVFPVEKHFERVVNFGIPATLLVFGVVNLDLRYEITYPDFFIKLGDASYTLYLSHIMVISAMGRIWQASGLNESQSNILFISCMLFAVVLYALLAYARIESPLLRYARKTGKGIFTEEN